MHIPVLKDQTINEFNYLKDSDGYFVDGTLGLAGHSLEIAKGNPRIKMIGIDKDENALVIAKDKIEKAGFSDRFILFHKDFSSIHEVMSELSIANIDGALLDLGVSSMQLDQPERGFTFQDPDARLDMRMDQSQEIDAAYVLNNYSSERLEKIFKEYGEERFAGNIAKNIAKKRIEQHYEKIGDLLETLQHSIPKKIIATSKKHYATNVFRALRMEINGEVAGLEKTLTKYVEALNPGAKLAVITFHSIEDRIVKNLFRSLENPCVCPAEVPCACGKKPIVKIAQRKPIIATEEELALNPRSRSAKLRVVEKI